jgi:hypothetical protein
MIRVLLAAEDARHEGYRATIEAAALSAALYWLTRVYADTLGVRLGRRSQLNAELLWRSCLHEVPILEGALIPIVALLVAWAAGFAVASGVTAALWATVASIVVLEVAAGWRSRDRRGIWLEAVASAALGLALIALKLVLH